jgi:small neutral amino acid transporter SnatA (MarC family)
METKVVKTKLVIYGVILVLSFAGLGILAPYLMSAADTFSVLGGILVGVICFSFIAAIIMDLLKYAFPEEDDTENKTPTN